MSRTKQSKKERVVEIETVNYSYAMFSFNIDDIAAASMEAKHMLYYNPESLLNARADYLSLSDTTRHVLSCLVAGEGFDSVGFSSTGKGRKRKSYIGTAKQYIKNVSKTVCTGRVFNEAKSFIESLDSEQLDNIQKIIV